MNQNTAAQKDVARLMDAVRFKPIEDAVTTAYLLGFQDGQKSATQIWCDAHNKQEG